MITPIALLFAFLFSACFIVLCALKLFGALPYRIGLTLGLAVLTYMYVQGNFFVSGLPALDGTDFDWSAHTNITISSPH